MKRKKSNKPKERMPKGYWMENTEDGWIVLEGGITVAGPDKDRERLKDSFLRNLEW